MMKPEINCNFVQIMKSAFRHRNIYPRAIAAAAKGAINVKPLVTHEFGFDHLQNASQEALNNRIDALRVIIKIK